MFVVHLNIQHRELVDTLTCNCLKLSVSSTCPNTCLTKACKISRQWILLPDDIGKLNDTKATVFGFGMPNGGSNDAKKSDTCEK